ncbi:MAG: DNA-deoxyinosine glycosylase [Lachnospiraceae bacterium]
MPDYQQVIHEFKPVFNHDSQILILGTFPSVKSREQHFYYGHPQNRFWKVLAAITNNSVPSSVENKINFLHSHRIAIWDVIQSCEIIGSSDSSIRNVIPTDISQLLLNSSISAIFGNGAKSCELYNKYIFPTIEIEIEKLPSTSPANAAWSLERLTKYWKTTLEPFLN